MTDPITPEYLDELDALSEAATEGPWAVLVTCGGEEVDGCCPDRALAGPDGVFARVDHYTDAAFIAAARQAVPRLVKALREAGAKSERDDMLLKRISDNADDWSERCRGADVRAEAAEASLTSRVEQVRNLKQACLRSDGRATRAEGEAGEARQTLRLVKGRLNEALSDAKREMHFREKAEADALRLEAALIRVVQAVEDYLAGANNRLAESIQPYANGAAPMLSRRTRKAEEEVKRLRKYITATAPSKSEAKRVISMCAARLDTSPETR